MNKFTHLHVHSHYSLLDGLAKIPELVKYTKELGMDSLALTDHGVLYGAIEFYKEAKKAGIKPIIGCEMYTALESMHQKRPNIDNKRNHLILLAKNQTGYKNLVKLVTKAHLEGFYYKPRIDDELLEKHSEGLICMTACLAGKLPRLLNARKPEQAEQFALKYQSIFGKDNFYLEIQHHPNIPEQISANKGIIEIAKKHNIPLVATNDVHYLKPENAKAQDILMLINTGADPNDPERLTMIGEDFSLTPPEKMIQNFKHIPEAIENTQKIVEQCNLEFELGKTILPKFVSPDGMNNEQHLRKLAEDGIAKRYGSPTPEITECFNYDLKVFSQTGFPSYFLIVRDFVKWSKENGIVVGPGRGSVSGSIVAYLLGITEIDPLKYDLLFERFLTGKRVSDPDIDLDFADVRRDEVIQYVVEKYGKEKVAQIITFGTMAARAVIRDVGRAMGYSYGYCDQIAKMIPMFYSLDQTLERVDDFKRKYNEEEKAKTLIDYARQLEGVARHASTHACGLVISDENLDNLVPVQHSSQNDLTIVSQYDMHCVESVGLLKMDFLGLKNLTIIERALNLIEENHKIRIDLNTLPLDDKKTFELLQKAQTTSVFQLESDGMKRYLKKLKPTQFEDIIALAALYRPGPMELIPRYIKRKHGKEKISYLHPKLEPILEETYGIMVYQEQLMRISREMAGFSSPEADVLRKAVGKKIQSLLNEQEKKFIQGMVDNKIEKRIAIEIWEWILPFAQYGFNKSHSACYAMIAFQTAYLKAHYPVEYMAAVFASERTDIERTAFLIEECKSMGIEVLAPDINESEPNFSVIDDKTIRFGLETVKNVGHNIVKAIVDERNRNGRFKNISDFVSRIDSKDLNKKSLQSLIKAGVFDKLNHERNELLFNMDMLLSWSRESRKQKANGQKGLFSNDKSFNGDIKLAKTDPAGKREKLMWEKELLGLYVTSHPLEDFTDLLRQTTLPISETIKKFIGRKKQVQVAGIISNIKRIITKSGKPMLFVTLEDQTQKVEVVVFPKIIEQYPTAFQENKIVFVSGTLDNKDGEPKLICEHIQEIVEANGDW